MRFGIRMHTITRDTAEEAWAEADRLLAGIDAEAIEKVQAGPAPQRVRGPAPDARPATRAARTAWRSTRTSGPGSGWSAAERAPRWSAATSRSPTGSRSTPTLGIDEFILSGYPHLEERLLVRRGSAADPGRAWSLGAPAPPRRPSQAVPFAARGSVVTGPRTAVVVGNPKPGSRTLAAAPRRPRADRRRAGPGGRPGDLGAGAARLAGPAVAALVDEVGAADLVVVASPTYKATYTGLLKLFLDRFAGGTGLRGVAVPLMLGAGPGHALAPELHLRPLLVELGASVPTRGALRARQRARPSGGVRRLAGALAARRDAPPRPHDRRLA